MNNQSKSIKFQTINHHHHHHHHHDNDDDGDDDDDDDDDDDHDHHHHHPITQQSLDYSTITRLLNNHPKI